MFCCRVGEKNITGGCYCVTSSSRRASRELYAASFLGNEEKKNQTAAVDHAVVFSEDCLQNSMTTNKEDTYASGSLGRILTESLRDARGIMCPRETQHIPLAKKLSLI